jgi:hypothetical protein
MENNERLPVLALIMGIITLGKLLFIQRFLRYRDERKRRVLSPFFDLARD